MRLLFFADNLNHPIGNWDVSNVKSMFGMFRGSSFNQSIEKWGLEPVEKILLKFGP